MSKIKFIHHDANREEVEWYEVIYEGARVLTVRRQTDWPNRWVATDIKGRQCFEPNGYRNDLFEQIEYEGDFTSV